MEKLFLITKLAVNLCGYIYKETLLNCIIVSSKTNIVVAILALMREPTSTVNLCYNIQENPLNCIIVHINTNIVVVILANMRRPTPLGLF